MVERMGMFRALSKKSIDHPHIIKCNNSFDSSNREESKSSGGGNQLTRRARFKFRRSVARDSSRSECSDASVTTSPTSATPLAQQSMMGNDNREHPIEEIANSSTSVLESLKIISEFDDPICSPYPLADGVEVVTPDTQHLMLKQRAAIRKILFDDTRENAALRSDLNCHRLKQSADLNNCSGEGRASPLPPPPPPITDANDLLKSSYISVDTHVSQEVFYDGLIRNASLEEVEYGFDNRTYEAKYMCNVKDVAMSEIDTSSICRLNEVSDEVCNVKAASSMGQSTPLSVDVSYNDRALASLSRKTMLVPGCKNDCLNSQDVHSVNSVADCPKKSNVSTFNDNERRSQVAATEASRTAVDVTLDQFHSGIQFRARDLDSVVETSFSNHLKTYSSDRPLIQPVLVDNAGQAAARALTKEKFLSCSSSDHSGRCRDGFSLATNQPEDENEYDEKLRDRIKSSIPDDERMEFSKDEVAEMIRLSKEFSKDEIVEMTRLSNSGTLDIVDMRHRPLASGGIPRGRAVRDDGTFESSVISKMKGPRLELSATVGNSHGLNFSNINKSVDLVPFQLSETLDIVENEHANEARSRDLVSEENIFSSLTCEGNMQKIPGRESSGIGIASRSDFDVVGDNAGDDDGTGCVASQNIKNGQRSCGGDNCPSPSDANEKKDGCEEIENKPSFIYTQDSMADSRFIRRMVNNGFVLLYLQPPGSLGNPTEDWNGRTVTMLIQKGILAPYSSCKNDKDSGASAWSSVTFSTKENYATGINIGTSIGSTKTPIVRHPRLQWLTVAGGLATDVSIISVDLLKIQAVSTSDDEVDYVSNLLPGSMSLPDDEENLCFFTVTSTEGVVHMFEAVSTNERNRIVQGLKALLARLSYHIISGNPTSSSELYHTLPLNGDRRAFDEAMCSSFKLNDNTNQSSVNASNIDLSPPSLLSPAVSGLSRCDEDIDDVELAGDLPLFSNPSDTMNRIAHVFLDL